MKNTCDMCKKPLAKWEVFTTGDENKWELCDECTCRYWRENKPLVLTFCSKCNKGYSFTTCMSGFTTLAAWECGYCEDSD